MPFQTQAEGLQGQPAAHISHLGIEPFRVALRRLSGDVTTVTPYGELDLATVETFERALSRALASPVCVLVLDLRGLELMDCSGLHRILDTEREASARGVALVVIPGGPAIRRLFELTGATQKLRQTPATTRRTSANNGHDRPLTEGAEHRLAVPPADHFGSSAGRGFTVATDNPLYGYRDPLTKRQQEILRLISEGSGTKEVARLLFISPATVRNHVSAILATLECHSRLQAVHRARELGLL